jgi:hypothetical protein
MNYIVIENTNLLILMVEVNEYYIVGYKPIGGICYCSATNCYLQAITNSNY